MDGKNQFSIKRIEPTSFVISKDRLLGKGAFGEVYWGFDDREKIPVAIKTISYSKLQQVYADEQAIGKKLADELASMQVCKSQRLVKLISPHRSSKNMYVVCEYCNGGSLKQYLNKKGQLSQFQTLSFFKDILEGFQKLNESRIVHRDMKPANLLLNNRRIKIGDLGFSKIISVHDQILISAVGTPLYMSPQILSNTYYTQKTDIWSLGVILYEMLVGDAPWKVTSLQQIKQKVRHKPEIPWNCYVSGKTKSLIFQMLTCQERQRIGWQDLFNQYLNHKSEMQQQLSSLEQKVKQTDQYFLFSLAIESQFHINSILQKNNRKYVQFYDGCQNGTQFFQRIKKMEQREKLIEPILNYYIESRNRNAFLMKLFVQCYKNCSELASPIVLASMLMILKYCICATEGMLTGYPEGTESLQLFTNSSYYENLMQLFDLDLEKMNSLLKVFQSQLLIPGLKELAVNHSDIVQTVQTDLKLFIGEQSAGIKFTEFWMKNECRQLFNAFKDLQVLPAKWMLIPRMIFQYEKSSKTHLFANMGEKSNMNKKLEVWAQEERSKTKIKEAKKFEIQSIVSFINREVTWNSLNMLGMSF